MAHRSQGLRLEAATRWPPLIHAQTRNARDQRFVTPAPAEGLEGPADLGQQRSGGKEEGSSLCAPLGVAEDVGPIEEIGHGEAGAQAPMSPGRPLPAEAQVGAEVDRKRGAV